MHVQFFRCPHPLLVLSAPARSIDRDPGCPPIQRRPGVRDGGRYNDGTMMLFILRCASSVFSTCASPLALFSSCLLCYTSDPLGTKQNTIRRFPRFPFPPHCLLPLHAPAPFRPPTILRPSAPSQAAPVGGPKTATPRHARPTHPPTPKHHGRLAGWLLS